MARTLGAAFELAALVERERNLVRRNLAGADAAFDAQSTRRKHERLAIGFRFQADRPHRADQAERDVNDVIAGRQHDVRGRAALLADQLERAGIVGLVGEHPPYQPAIDDRQILAVARRQRQHRLARDRGAGGGTAGGTVASDGCTMVGWFNGAGSVGIAPAPEGGARFSAGPLGASGTEAGGTGGGRSWNIWAEAEAGKSADQRHLQAPAPEETSRPARVPRNRCPLKSWPCFSPKTRQIQASDGKFGVAATTGPIGTPNIDPAVVAQSQSLPSSLSTGINHAC